ncbi:hypothetical protein KY290_010895 [Solanum tuberosum]|uniref:Integrase core domain containing protein n=1 Tax=Solanum tuberosum TaxID=4113 RepID=A0ABQ7W116_SOLTU|nr:hypothetical protein KY290_010895 [Solanum tuberosum]
MHTKYTDPPPNVYKPNDPTSSSSRSHAMSKAETQNASSNPATNAKPESPDLARVLSPLSPLSVHTRIVQMEQSHARSILAPQIERFFSQFR